MPDRASSTGEGRRCRTSLVSHDAAISMRSALSSSSCSGGVRSARSRMLEQVRDVFELLHQGPARDLGGVRGEHQLDAQAADGLVQPVGRDAGGDEPAKRLVARSDLGRRGLVALIVAAAPDAMVLLGDVGQVEEVGEGARDRQRLVDGHLLEDAGQRRKVGVAAAARLLGQRADPLDQVEDRLALVAPQRLAQQLAQQPDIFPQCLR